MSIRWTNGIWGAENLCAWGTFRWAQTGGPKSAFTSEQYFDRRYWLRRDGGIWEGDGSDASATGTSPLLPESLGDVADEITVEASR